jgi:hypothetical protein
MRFIKEKMGIEENFYQIACRRNFSTELDELHRKPIFCVSILPQNVFIKIAGLRID